MFTIKKAKIKNFLSYGNTPTVIRFDELPKTLVNGMNGHGKSVVFTDAICYALFNKPYRNINKPNLVNSVNQKGLEVELEFNVNGKEYRIRRGIKPAIFELYSGDTLINQTASSKDYQAYLEENILKLNYKTFCQVVILGAKSYVPFMSLKSHERREIIENILDIEVFSKMNIILKDKITQNNSDLDEIKIDAKIASEKVKIITSHEEDKKKNKLEQVVRIETEIADNKDTVSFLEASLDKKNKMLELTTENISKLGKYKDTEKNVDSLLTTFSNENKVYKREIEFFNENDTCIKCKQDIPHEHKSRIMDDLESRVSANDAKLLKVQEAQKQVLNKVALLSELVEKQYSINNDITKINTQIRNTNSYINKLEQNVIELQTVSEEDTNTGLSDLTDELVKLNVRKEALVKKRNTFGYAILLLKDSGIKTRIIKKYIPLINKYVNKYLDTMNFFVKFEFDENFDEQIKSRHRDAFSYANFSEGEKQRIDLALMFTFRSIAKMKNSINCNLLVMDETFDSSLDASGTDDLIKILYDLEKTNLFVISHKNENLADKFDQVLTVVKKNNFSNIIKD